MRKYITLVGRDYWLTLNSLWAVLKEERFRPDQVYLLAEEGLKKRSNTLKKDIDHLLKAYGLNPRIEERITQDADFYHAGKEVQKVIDESDENDILALDITGGRKALVAGSLVNPSAKDFKHVFYLYIDFLDGAKKPYPAIHTEKMMLRDFVQEHQEGE